MIMPFCSPWCESENSRDRSSSTRSSRRFSVEGTLRRDYLFFKVHQLSLSKTAQEAETVLRELDQGLVDGEQNDDEHDTPALLHSLDEVAGAIAIIHKVLNREEKSSRPSPLVAAPLLYRFAHHGIGFDKIPIKNDRVVACEPIRRSSEVDAA